MVRTGLVPGRDTGQAYRGGYEKLSDIEYSPFGP